MPFLGFFLYLVLKILLHVHYFAVWNNVYGFNMSCIRKQAIAEPLVDTVEQNQIVTNCQMLKVGTSLLTSLSLIIVNIDPLGHAVHWELLSYIICISWFQTMDISKMDSVDASFTAPFKLVAERDDYIHALVAYFDVSFTKCHKLMGFSTGRCCYKSTFLKLFVTPSLPYSYYICCFP